MTYRVLLVSREYPPDTGGIAAFTSTLAPALARRGHDVHVLSCRAGHTSSDTYLDGFWLHRRSEYRIRGLRRLSRTTRTADRIEAAFSAWRESRKLGVDFDVVHAGNYFAEGLFFGLSRSTPLLVWLHTHSLMNAIESGWEIDRDTRWMDAVERLTASTADLVCTGSNHHVATVRQTGWLKNRRVRVLRPPVDIASWQGLPGAEMTGPVILQVGRLEARKRPEVGLQAMEILASEIPNARIIFVGRPVDAFRGVPYDEWLMTQGRNLSGRVEVTGEVSFDQLRDYYGLARVCIVPSSHESFGLVVAQAMAAGRPVIASDVVGASELLVDGGGGRTVPYGDAQALAYAVKPFLRDPALAKRTGEAAQRIVAETCDPDLVASRIESAYAEAIKFWRSRRILERFGSRRKTVRCAGS